MNKRNLFLIVGFLIVLICLISFSTASYRSSSKYSYGGLGGAFATNPRADFDPNLCQEGQDFIIQIDAAGCTPSVVRSDLLEEQDVPVFCPLKATKLNPLIDVETIRSMTFGGQFPPEVRSVGFHPSKAALSSREDITNPFYDDIGYAVVMLRSQPNESAMPEFVEGNLTATIRYDVENAFGIRQNNFFLPVMSDSEWEDKKNRYSFWDAKGYLRLQNIHDNSASITLYSDVYRTSFEGKMDQKREFGTIDLKKGETSGLLFFPGFYCLAGLKLRLDEITHADTRALLKINSEYVEVRKGEKFLEDRCHIKSEFRNQGINKKVDIYCKEDIGGFWGGNNIPLNIAPELKLKINGKEAIHSIGDKLYDTDNGYTVYLGYAKLLREENKQDELKIYLVSKKKSIGKTSLSNDEIGTEAKLAEAYEWEDSGGRIGILGFIGELADSSWARGVKTFNEIYFGTTHAIVSNANRGDLKTFEGFTIELVGFSEGQDNEFTSELLSDYFNFAETNYDIVSGNFQTSKYPDTDNNSITLGEQSLRAKIDLFSALDQKATLKELCLEFEATFASATLPTICENIKNLADVGSKVEKVLINGNVREISLIDIYEPTFQNYGVGLFVQDSSGNSELLPLEKNKKFYLKYLGNSEFSDIFSVRNRQSDPFKHNFPFVHFRYHSNEDPSKEKWVWSVDKKNWMDVTEYSITAGQWVERSPSKTNLNLIASLQSLNYEEGRKKFPVNVAQDKGDFVELVKITSQEEAEIQISAYKDSYFEKEGDLWLGEVETLRKDVPKTFGTQYSFVLREINLDEYARVSVIPEVNYQRTDAEFKFKIFIEKRAIKLTPEKIEERVEQLNKTIEQWTQISNTLGDVVKTLKTACVGASAVLTVKNLFANSGGKSMARTEVMKGDDGWAEHCAEEVNKENSDFRSVDECYLRNADAIERDVNLLHDKLKAQNKRIEDLQNQCPQKSNLLESKSVDTGCLMGKLSDQITKNMENEVIKNPHGGDDEIDLEKIKAVLNKKGWENHTYSIDQLRDIEIYYDLWIDAKNQNNTKDIEKYGKRLYSVLDQVQKNSQTYTAKETFKNTFGFDEVIIGGQDKDTKKYFISKTKKFGDFKGKFDTSKIPERQISDDNNVYGYKDSLTNVDYILLLNDDDVIIQTYNITYEEDKSVLRIADKNNINPLKLSLERRNKASYKNKYLNPELKYYESEPYKGQPALVPFDLENGWYIYASPSLGVAGNLASYYKSGLPNSFRLCNVGPNGLAEYPAQAIDDICQGINADTGQPYSEFHDLSPSETSELLSRAKRAMYQAQTSQNKKIGSSIPILENQIVPIGSPETGVPLVQCADFMSVKDCQILFNVCDPVVCPNSRCNFGGKYQVKDVIQSGIIGSLILCLPNFNEGVYLPVCVSGVKAGLDGWISISRSYKDCLQHNLDTGETIGICDEMHSIYMCEFFWRQALPIAKVLFPKLLGLLTGESTVRGGGEYMFVQSALDTADKSVNYLTQNYAVDAYNAFKFRNSEQVGSAVCKNFISVNYPGGADVLDTLTDPDSPSQFTGKFDEIPFSTATSPPISHYKVYYHIYAGTDRGAYYRVYLREGGENLYYQKDFFGRAIGSGYIPKGEYASETIDMTAPSGMKELCINVNGQEECGFGQVSTNFAVNYIKDKYIENQATQNQITSEKACISGTASFYSLLNPNMQEGVGDLIDPQIYNKGLIRICATDNPGTGPDTIGQETPRWIDMGYCGDKQMRCWLDTNSIDKAVEFSYTKDQILEEVSEDLMEKLYNLSEYDYVTPEEFANKIKKIENQKDPERRIELIDEIFDRVFFVHEKGYLYLLKGNAYADLAKKAFNLLKRDQEEVVKDSCEEIAKQNVLNVLESLLGTSATRQDDNPDAVIHSCDSDSVVDCFDIVMYAYEKAKVDFRCVYSDKNNKKYEIYEGAEVINITTGDKSDDPFAVNPKDCKFKDMSEDEKLSLLKPGYLISYYWGSNNERAFGHNAIFVRWKDPASRVAILFDGNGGAKNDEKFRYYEADLSNSAHPVYLFVRPRLTQEDEIINCKCFNDENVVGVCLDTDDCYGTPIVGKCPGKDYVQCCIGQEDAPTDYPVNVEWEVQNIMNYFYNSTNPSFVSSSLEFNDGSDAKNIFYRYAGGQWQVKGNENENWVSIDTPNLGQKLGISSYDHFFFFYFKTKAQNKSLNFDYLTGLNFLIEEGILGGKTAISSADLTSGNANVFFSEGDKYFTLETDDRIIKKIYFRHDGNEWKWAFTDDLVWIDLEHTSADQILKQGYGQSNARHYAPQEAGAQASMALFGGVGGTKNELEGIISYADTNVAQKYKDIMFLLRDKDFKQGAAILYNWKGLFIYMEDNGLIPEQSFIVTAVHREDVANLFHSSISKDQINNAHPSLIRFLYCVSQDYAETTGGKNIVITSITDDDLYGAPGTTPDCNLEDTYEEFEDDSNCVHGRTSCHYYPFNRGKKPMTNDQVQSLAVDIRTRKLEVSAFDLALKVCSSFEPRLYKSGKNYYDEGNHFHLSLQECFVSKLYDKNPISEDPDEVVAGITYIPINYTLETAMQAIKNLYGKYSDNPENEKFIDDLCFKTGTEGVFTKEECNKIKGDWGVAGWGGESSMEDIKKMLIARSYDKDNNWTISAAILKTRLFYDNPTRGMFGRNEIVVDLFKVFLKDLNKDGVLSDEKYNELDNSHLLNSGKTQDFLDATIVLEIYLENSRT